MSDQAIIAFSMCLAWIILGLRVPNEGPGLVVACAVMAAGTLALGLVNL